MIIPILSQFDRKLFLLINGGMASPFNDILFGLLTVLGCAPITLFLASSYLCLLDRKRFWRNLVLMFVAALMGAIWVHILKWFFHRPRPLNEMAAMIDSGRVVIHYLFYPLQMNSFPSGHAQSAFAIATVLSYLDQRHSLFFVFAAFMLSLARVYAGVHYPLDILAGALIGFVGAVLGMRLCGVNFFSLRTRNGHLPRSN